MQKVRRLPLAHAYNVRDLGGYAIDEHKMTKWHQLYRGDCLHQLDAKDWEQLVNRNIKLIIDLRSEAEAAGQSYDCEKYGIRRVFLPFMKQDIDTTQLQKEKSRESFLQSMKLQYEVMIEEVPEQIVKAMELIAQALSMQEAVLFHCTAGKDRTGMLSVLLLSLCQVSRFDIIADYQVSATYNTLGVNKMLPKEYMQVPEVKALFDSTPEMILPLVEKLEAEGCAAYLKRIGCSTESLERIQRAFIDER